MAPPLMNLPAYNPGNMLLNFAPLNEAIDDYSKNKLLNRQQDREDARLGLEKQRLGIAKGEAELNQAAHAAKLYGGVAQQALELHEKGDVAGAQALYSKILSNPRMRSSLTEHGQDTADMVGTSRFLMAQAAGYRDPLAAEAQRANIAQSRQAIEASRHSMLTAPEQAALAAGVTRGSPEWVEIMRESIPKQSPMDKFVRGALQPDAAPAPQPQPMASPPQQPVNALIPPQQQPLAAGTGPYGTVPPNALAAPPQLQAPAPQPVAPAPIAAPTPAAASAEPMINVLGKPMPISQARKTAQAMLASKGYEKLGEAVLKDINAADKGSMPMDAESRAKLEAELRKEVSALSKDYFVVRDNINKMEQFATDKSGASDIAMIFAFMKAQDPNSVVRETEFATAQNAAGVSEKIRNLYNKAIEGEFLTPKQRSDFLNTARAAAGEQHKQYERTLNHYEGIATRNKLDPANVVMREPAPQAWTPRQAEAPKSNKPAPLVPVPLPQFDDAGKWKGWNMQAAGAK